MSVVFPHFLASNLQRTLRNFIVRQTNSFICNMFHGAYDFPKIPANQVNEYALVAIWCDYSTPFYSHEYVVVAVVVVGSQSEMNWNEMQWLTHWCHANWISMAVIDCERGSSTFHFSYILLSTYIHTYTYTTVC